MDGGGMGGGGGFDAGAPDIEEVGEDLPDLEEVDEVD